MSNRVFVLSGQGGWATSYGMLQLADKISKFADVTSHIWSDTSILKEINDLVSSGSKKVIIIGYSLGANQLGWFDTYIRNYSKKPIDLGVAIDPSKLSPLVHRNSKGEYVQSISKYKKLICFYHPRAWVFGGSKFEGENVENIEINIPHLMIQFDIDIHLRIIKEIKQLEEK